MIAYDAANDPQAQASALFTFGRYERLKDSLQEILRDPTAGVGDQNPDTTQWKLFAGADMTCPNQQSSAFGHAVPGIDYQVREDLSQLIGSRSEEHTSELQSRQYLVCRLLLEKKKTKKKIVKL